MIVAPPVEIATQSHHGVAGVRFGVLARHWQAATGSGCLFFFYFFLFLFFIYLFIYFFLFFIIIDTHCALLLQLYR